MSTITPRNYAEKRDYIRMQVDTAITLTNPKDDEQYQAICRDLSGMGMSIEVNCHFSKDTELNTLLPSNNPMLPPLDTTIRVIRCEDLANRKYLLGAEIISIKK